MDTETTSRQEADWQHASACPPHQEHGRVAIPPNIGPIPESERVDISVLPIAEELARAIEAVLTHYVALHDLAERSGVSLDEQSASLAGAVRPVSGRTGNRVATGVDRTFPVRNDSGERANERRDLSRCAPMRSVALGWDARSSSSTIEPDHA